MKATIFRKILRFLMPSLAMAAAVQAQTYFVPQPDCLIFFHFTVTGQTSPTSPNAGLDNRTNGCTTWNLSFTSVTLTNATVTLQSAPNTATGVPGAWVTYANQVVINGTNPLAIAATPAAGFAWVVGYNPWVRVTLTIAGGPATGVVDGAAYGWRIPSASAQSGAANAVTITGPLGQTTMASSIPVVIASNQTPVGAQAYRFNGSTWDADFACTHQAAFDLAAAGNTQIVAASGTTIVRICHLSMSTTAAEDIKITQGTGANCVTGTADLTGLYKQVAALAFDFGSVSALRGSAGSAICINQSGTQATGGVVIYAQY